jgi:beta-lactam-binding protein with PASTA domain
MPDVRCQPIVTAKSRVSGAGFVVEVDPSPVPSNCPFGTVAGTNPTGRTVKGGIVVIQISNGKGDGTPPTSTPAQRGNGNGLQPGWLRGIAPGRRNA